MIIFLTIIALVTITSPSIKHTTKHTTPSFAEEFQSLGLKGKVEVVDKHREIEAF